MESDISLDDVHRTRSKLEAYEDFNMFKGADLKTRVEEMLRIKGDSFFTNVFLQRIYVLKFFSDIVCYKYYFVYSIISIELLLNLIRGSYFQILVR